MDEADVLRRLDDERRSLARDGERLERLPRLTRLCTDDDTGHGVIWSDLTAESADAAIAAEVAHHRGLGVGFEWKFFAHDHPADLTDRLRRQGFNVGPLEAVLVAPLDPMPAWSGNAAQGISVRRVERPEQVEDFRRAAGAIFGKDYSQTADRLADGLRTGSTQHLGYVAYDGDQPVGVGRLYTHPQSWFGGLYGGGTLASHRGRGVYRAMVAARARDAVALGAKYVQVDALPTSRPILERLGFRRLTDTWPCEWRPAACD